MENLNKEQISALFVEFMNIPKYGDSEYVYNNKIYNLSNMEFETSFECVMPVLEKICKLRIGNGLVDSPYLRTFGMINEKTGGIMVRLNGFQLFEAETLLKAIYLAVVDFLVWYKY